MLKYSLAILTLVAVAACSHGNTNSSQASSDSNAATDTSSPAAASSDASPQSATIQTGNGAVTIANSADTSKMGAPVYPGATSDSAHSVSISGGGNAGTSLSTFKTTDGFDKVYDFYKQQLPPNSEKYKVTTGGVSTAAFELTAADGLTTMVSITTKADETTILLEHMPGK